MENLFIMTVHPLTSYDVIPLGTTTERERENQERDKTRLESCHLAINSMSDLTGEESHICLLGVCLLITYVPSPPIYYTTIE